MKKFLIVLCCVALLLPAAALSAFAENDTVVATIKKSADTNPDARFTIFIGDSSGTAFYSNEPLSTTPQNYTFHLDTVYCWYCPLNDGQPHYAVVRYFNGSKYVVCSTDPSNPTVIDPSVISDLSFETILGAFYTTPTYCYFTFPSPPPEPLEELGVNDGVDSSISYTGQVLHFLATNTTTIVLIGLSVAMFAVLPFAISKIKQIIKGY